MFPAGDGCVVLALQVIPHRVAGDLRSGGIVVVLQIAMNVVTDQKRRGSVVLDLQIPADGVAGARCAVDLDASRAVLILQISLHRRAADLVLRRVRRKILDLKIAADVRHVDVEPAALDLHVSAHGRAHQGQRTPVLRRIAGGAAIYEDAALARRDGNVAVERSVIRSIADRAGSRSSPAGSPRRQKNHRGGRRRLPIHLGRKY